MKDFIGNPISVGTYIAIPGAGNKTSEYGMLLAKVVSVNEEKKTIGIRRIRVDYAQSPDGNSRGVFHPSHLKNAIISSVKKMRPVRCEGKWVQKEVVIEAAVRWISGTMTNLNRCVVVDPQEEIKVIFEKILNQDITVFDLIDAHIIANWILGSGAAYNPFSK